MGGLSFSGSWLSTIQSIALSPLIILGVALYAVSTILAIILLAKIELSIFSLVTSISFVISLGFSYFMFGESITLPKIAGCLLILAGVFLVTR